MPFSIHSIYQQLFKVWRRRRHALFARILQPAAADVLLDVGGYPAFWVQYPQVVQRIDSINLHAVEWVIPKSYIAVRRKPPASKHS